MPDLSNRPASVAEYRDLRVAAGLPVHPDDAARQGLANTLHGVWLRDADGAIVGMGRLIGNGGCFAQVTDIAVHPRFQRQGRGAAIMAALMSWAQAHLPPTCYIRLIADPRAERLYEKFGFSKRYGMARRAG